MLESDPADIRDSVLRQLGEKYAPSVEQFALALEFGRNVRSSVG